MALTAAQVADQKKKAEEDMLGTVEHLGFAKSLFFGRFRGELLFPYPVLAGRTRPKSPTRPPPRCGSSPTPTSTHMRIDRESRIPDSRDPGPGPTWACTR